MLWKSSMCRPQIISCLEVVFICLKLKQSFVIQVEIIHIVGVCSLLSGFLIFAFMLQIYKEFKRIAEWDILERLNKGLDKYYEKINLLASKNDIQEKLKGAISAARTAGERKYKWYLLLVLRVFTLNSTLKYRGCQK